MQSSPGMAFKKKNYNRGSLVARPIDKFVLKENVSNNNNANRIRKLMKRAQQLGRSRKTCGTLPKIAFTFA